MDRKEIRVPDLGDFKDVPVIEVHVGPGSAVTPEDSLITLESDKATFDVPAPEGGEVAEILVKVGDRVSHGSPILVLEVAEDVGTRTPEPVESDSARSVSPSAPRATIFDGEANHVCQVLVLGAGPGGYSAAFRAADFGARTVLVDRWPTLGGVCLNVGCIPSKALLHTAAVIDEAANLTKAGITFNASKIDLAKLAAHKSALVARLTNALAAMAKAREVTVMQGTGTFLDAHHLSVTAQSGRASIVRFDKAIVAAGSEAVRLPFLPDDARIVDSTGALELAQIPQRMLVIGGGIIGLEMATVYSTLGARVDVAEASDGLIPGVDRDLVAVWQKRNSARFGRLMLRTKAVAADAKKNGIRVAFEGADAPPEPQSYGLVLVAVGRKPNGHMLGLENAGVAVTEKGFVSIDKQMRTNVSHIFAVGDIAGDPMLAHKAVHEGHVAAENAAGKAAHFDAHQIPSVAYTDPEIAWTGLTEAEAKARGLKCRKSVFPWAASGRAIANGRDEGLTKLLFDEEDGRIIGGGIVGTHAGDLIGEVCLAIEMGADAVDIGKTIHPHPTLSESIGMAAEALEGTCTDLPPVRSPRSAISR